MKKWGESNLFAFLLFIQVISEQYNLIVENIWQNLYFGVELIEETSEKT